MKKPELSVVISTYNSPVWLKKVLVGYEVQSFKDYELVIADDGSGPETVELIKKIKDTFPVPVIHVWHEDQGFQKSAILNKAVQECNSDYILMSDGDCIPRKDFVEVHYDKRRPGYFLSGGYFKLPMNISEEITEENIHRQDCFDVDWLQARGLQRSFKNRKLAADGLEEKLLNFLTPTKATWNGHNSSGWKKDILAVNGFDERMQYGGQDRELGERLFNKGIKSSQVRYSAVCVHLDHPRGYKTDQSIEKNLGIRAKTKSEKRVWTSYGIQKDL